MNLPAPLDKLVEGSKVSWSDAFWLVDAPDDLVMPLFWGWDELRGEVGDLGERIANWGEWADHFEEVTSNLAAGIVLDCDLGVGEPQLGEGLGEWCSRIVGDATRWYSDESCIRVAPGGVVAQYFCFCDAAELTLLVMREQGTSRTCLFSFCPA